MQKFKDLLTRIYFLKIHPLFFVFPFCSWSIFRSAMHRMRYDLWADEYYQIEAMSLPLFEFLKRLPKREFCSYLSGDYYLVYPFYQMFGENKWGLATPHILLTLFGFYIAYLICKKYMKSLWGYVIAFAVIAFNEELKLHAFEIRTYAALPTLALASFYFQHRLILTPGSVTSKQKWWMRLFFFITILWHAYGVLITFIPTVYFLGTMVREEKFKKIFKDIFHFFFPVALATLPIWLFSVFGPHLKVMRIGTFEYVPNPLVDFIAFLKFIFGNLMGYRKLYFLLAGLVLAFLLPHKRRYQMMGFFLILIVLPIALIFVADNISNYWFLQRQFIWVIPYFALCIGLCWESIIEYSLGLQKNESLDFSRKI